MKHFDTFVFSGLFLLASACNLGDKSVGNESADDSAGSGSDGGDDGDGDGGDGGSATSGVADSGSDGSCPPDGCYDPCAGKSCGASCNLCDPAVPECAVPPIATACDAAGECVEAVGNLCGPWDPCLDQPCGQPCTMCAPWDFGCVETGEEKVCDGAGACVPLGGETCAGPSLEPGFEVDLGAGGCGDVFLYAPNPTDTVMLTVTDDDAVAETMAAGMAQHFEYDLSAGLADPDVFVEVGQFVSAYACTDVIENKPVISETWHAVAGTLALDVELPDMNGFTTATATLTDVVFQLDGDPAYEITVPTFVFTDIAVGWLPG